MQLIAGLGNPGTQYVGTPHNLGFEVADVLARRWGVAWREVSRWRGAVARKSGGDQTLTLLKPLTYMNLSGQAVGAVADFYGIDSGEVLAILDDFNLPMGRLRLRASGSDGGHNGLKSLIEHLGTTDFPRLRIGCAPSTGDMGDPVRFVLGRLTSRDRRWMERAVEAAADAVEAILDIGLERAMTHFNGFEIPPPDISDK